MSKRTEDQRGAVVSSICWIVGIVLMGGAVNIAAALALLLVSVAVAYNEYLRNEHDKRDAQEIIE